MSKSRRDYVVLILLQGVLRVILKEMCTVMLCVGDDVVNRSEKTDLPVNASCNKTCNNTFQPHIINNRCVNIKKQHLQHLNDKKC